MTGRPRSGSGRELSLKIATGMIESDVTAFLSDDLLSRRGGRGNHDAGVGRGGMSGEMAKRQNCRFGYGML